MVDAKVRGAFILFEGIDRCGKSTQARCLLDALRSQGLQVEIINFPNRTTPIGKIINEYLIGNTDINGQALHLMFSANRWEMKEYIESRLASGTSLIVDRYVYSGIAFSVAKGLDIEWCKSSDIGLPNPDITILLDMSIDETQRRSGYGQERYENEAMQTQVRRIFQMLQRPEWKIVNAARPMDVVHREIRSFVMSDLERIMKNPISHIAAEI